MSDVLICGANWLGDSVMSMPAVQFYKKQHPDSKITMLVKQRQGLLWGLHSDIDEVIELQSTFAGTIRASSIVRQRRFDKAFVFPNSFRSALIPYLGGVSSRIGFAGHHRSFFLSSIISISPEILAKHQEWEYMKILGLESENQDLDAPQLYIPNELKKRAMSMGSVDGCSKYIGICPGAAYGPSKRWPPEYFAKAARIISDKTNAGILVFGSPKEYAICSEVVDGIGVNAINLAGKTSVPELAALLSECSVVLTNDSGGMHLASAVGSRVVAVFGITDPSKTGPLGKGHCVITKDGVAQSRDIARNSREAEQALFSIEPERVSAAALAIMDDV